MAVRNYNVAASLREDFQDADLGPAEILRWVGGALVAGALVAVILTAVHRAGYGLLIALILGVVLLVLGGMLLYVDRRARRIRVLTAAVTDDLRAAADVIHKESQAISAMARDRKGDLESEIPLHIAWFADYTERLAATLAGDGLTDEQADQLRATRGPGGEVIPPAALSYAGLETATDLLNVLAQYREVLLHLAGGRAIRA